MRVDQRSRFLPRRGRGSGADAVRADGATAAGCGETPNAPTSVIPAKAGTQPGRTWPERDQAADLSAPSDESGQMVPVTIYFEWISGWWFAVGFIGGQLELSARGVYCRLRNCWSNRMQINLTTVHAQIIGFLSAVLSIPLAIWLWAGIGAADVVWWYVLCNFAFLIYVSSWIRTAKFFKRKKE